MIDADAPKGWAWRWLLLRYEVDLDRPLRHPIEEHRTVGDDRAEIAAALRAWADDYVLTGRARLDRSWRDALGEAAGS